MRGAEGQGPGRHGAKPHTPFYPMERIAGTGSPCGKCVANGACYLGSRPSAEPKDACKPIRARVESACHSGWICHPIVRAPKGKGPGEDGAKPHTPFILWIAGAESPCGKRVAGGACYLGSRPGAGPKGACKPIRARVESACHSGCVCYPVVWAPKGKSPGEHGAKPHTPFILAIQL